MTDAMLNWIAILPVVWMFGQIVYYSVAKPTRTNHKENHNARF